MGPRIATAPLGSGMEGESMVPASSRSRPGAGGDRFVRFSPDRFLSANLTLSHVSASTYRPGSVYAEPYLAQPAYGRGEPIRLPSSALMGGPSLYKSGGRMEDDSTASLLGGGTSQKGMTAAQMEIAELVTVPVLGAEFVSTSPSPFRGFTTDLRFSGGSARSCTICPRRAEQRSAR